MNRNAFLLTISFCILLFPAGCLQTPSEKIHTGQVIGPDTELPVGARFADFNFIDQDGQGQSLTRAMGTFTVLTFTECREGYTSYINQLATLIEEKSDWRVRVVGIDVYWDPIGCDPNQICAYRPDIRRPNLITVCDEDDIVRTRYRVTRPGRYFIIGPYGRIVGKGYLNEIPVLQRQLERLIDAHLQEQDFGESA